MRSRFDEQLALLNKEMIEMGALCEEVIALASKALTEADPELAKKVAPLDAEIDQKERNIESLCLKLLLQQQPVARDLRQISAALKMITDMERIGDQAEDIAEIIQFLAGRSAENDDLLREMARSTIHMVTESVDAYVQRDTMLAETVIAEDDVVDNAFDEVKRRLIDKIAAHPEDGEYALDLLMIAKYFERIGDHATNIAQWVVFSVTGVHKEGKAMIWCVEDDASIRDIEVYTLSSTGFDARGFADGVSFWAALQTEKPDLVVLDVMLPGVDGIELLQRMKASAELRTIPVVMATAKGAEYDRIRGLDLGADYYLVKPFGVMELVSCVKAVLRRCQPEKAAHLLRSGGLVVDLNAHTVTVDGARVALTYKEFELLRLFLSHPGMAFTRDQLFQEIWGMDYCGETRTVDMHIRTLRQKLGPYGRRIETVRNVGYRMEATT